jgi:flagellar protein FliO/FliZ
MFLAATGLAGVLKSVFQLIFLIILFVAILFMAYWTSKVSARFQNKTMQNGNIEIIETSRLQNNKYIQLVRIADKYVAVAVGKDEVHMLTEVSEESLVKRDSARASSVSFKDVLGAIVPNKNSDSKGQDSHVLEEGQKDNEQTSDR